MHALQLVIDPALKLHDQAIGTEVWPASRVMLKWMASADDAPKLSGATILELGSGTGALAMALVAQLGVRRVFASEGNIDVLDNLRANVIHNEMGSSVVPCMWDWGTSLMPPDEVVLDTVDLVIATDVVYVGTEECRLSHALANLCRPVRIGSKGRCAWLCLADRPLGGERFIAPPELDEGIDPSFDTDGRRMSAVARFVSACARRQLHVEELEIEPSLIESATRDAGCVGGRREFEGRITMFCVQHIT